MSIKTYKRTVEDLKRSLNKKHLKNHCTKPIKELIQENEEYFNNLDDKPVNELTTDDKYFIDLNLQIMEDFTEEDLKEFSIEEKQIINSKL